jgi:hypothetical protein
MSLNKFIFNGRPDGIGNRIEELIYIQEYCIDNNLSCFYVWNNTIKFRSYNPLITFDNITIIKDKKNINNLVTKNNEIFKRTNGNIIKYKFNFNVDIKEDYDIIVHIRATDRLVSNGKGDFSSESELKGFIERSINYINNNLNIQTYTIVCDDAKYKKYVFNKITKRFINLSYDNNIPRDWLDYYYLTKCKQSILMCCKFSSYSITASMLGDKKLLVFPESLNSNLPRYKANIEIIS